LQQVENKLQQKSRFYLSQARSATRDTLEAVQMAASGVAGLPGRKTIVLFSDGFFVEESRNQLQQLAGIAARVGATIYAVDGRGLMGGKRGAPDVVTAQRGLDGNLDTGEDGHEMLASGTGGFVVRQTDDVARALDSIARDTSSYYVLGYRPSNVTMDGKFRTIKVVARSTELTVRARQGYVAAAIK
jgi:VWFA-related protein